MPVARARTAAFDTLLEVERGAFSDLALNARLAAWRGGARRREDAALATELVFGVLRWQGLLDFLLERATGRAAASLDPEVRVALRLGLYQLRHLERIPAAAAVNEAVELVKRARKKSAAGLVNAALRRAPRQAAEELVTASLPAAERMAILHSHPEWMVARWLRQWGAERARALLEADNQPPRVACVIHSAERRAETEAEFKRAGISFGPARWLRDAVHIRRGNPAETAAFAQGWISLQDEASQMVAHLLDAQPGESVLDVCAAPGGKCALLARAARPGPVLACDIHQHRLRAMKENLARTGEANVHLLATDAAAGLPLGREFPRILVDAPCSGTGTLARNPEIRWRIRPADLADLQARQAAILRHAAALLAPGGRLVFATCSFEPEENERVAETLIAARRDLRLIRAADALRRHLHPSLTGAAEQFFDAAGFFRTFPPEHGTDGFFAAVLERAR
jgi:16S rRNA (cytosine967-C5)-methyltransferase